MPISKIITRTVKVPEKYQNLADPTQSRRISEDIIDIAEQINKNVQVKQIPQPQNFTATAVGTAVVLSWDDVDKDYIDSLHGAKIYRADASLDDTTDFYSNDVRTLVVACSRTTKYTDIEVVAGDWIYWVQWINRDQVGSIIAGGVSVTVS